MKRKAFLRALVALCAAPSLIEKIRAEQAWRVRKVYTGDLRISRGMLATLEAEEGAFVRYADQLLRDLSATRLHEIDREFYGGLL